MIINSKEDQLQFENHLLEIYAKRTSGLIDNRTRPYKSLDKIVQIELSEILNFQEGERPLLAHFNSSSNIVVISNQRLLWAIETTKINTLAWDAIKSINLRPAQQQVEIIEKSAKMHVIDFESRPQLASIHWCLIALHSSSRFQQEAVNDPDAYAAHKFSADHREQIIQSSLCGCFCCLCTFAPSSIEQWIDGEDTALCPQCSIDAVIGSRSGYPVTKEFLKRMKKFWFNAEP